VVPTPYSLSFLCNPRVYTHSTCHSKTTGRDCQTSMPALQGLLSGLGLPSICWCQTYLPTKWSVCLLNRKPQHGCPYTHLQSPCNSLWGARCVPLLLPGVQRSTATSHTKGQTAARRPGIWFQASPAV
jgi:hypothetical protein